MIEGLAPVADRALGFSVVARNVRGQMVRLDAALNVVLAAHDYPAPLARLLAEALTVTALLGATLLPAADLVARLAWAPVEIPVGVLTAMLGAPFFLALLARRPA